MDTEESSSEAAASSTKGDLSDAGTAEAKTPTNKSGKDKIDGGSSEKISIIHPFFGELVRIIHLYQRNAY